MREHLTSRSDIPGLREIHEAPEGLRDDVCLGCKQAGAEGQRVERARPQLPVAINLPTQRVPNVQQIDLALAAQPYRNYLLVSPADFGDDLRAWDVTHCRIDCDHDRVA